MSSSVAEDTKSVTELKTKTDEILRQIHETGRPVIVTVNGKPEAVLLDHDVYEKKLQTFNLAALLAEAETDVRNGNVRSVREFLKDFKGRAAIPG